MIDVSLAAVPNQTLSIDLDSSAYEITIHDANGAAACTIVRDGTTLVSGMRLTTGVPVIPYRYLETGNFIFTTQGDALPDFTQYGVTQFLTYLSAAELAAFRA